jgi:hypothetical protein
MGVSGQGAPAKWVLVTLAQQCREAGSPNTCRPSLARLAELTELGRSTVKRALADLERAGLLGRSRGGGDQSTVYTLALDLARSGPGVGLERTGSNGDRVQSGPGAGPEDASPPAHSGRSPRLPVDPPLAHRGPPAVTDQPLAGFGTSAATRVPARLHHHVGCSEDARYGEKTFGLVPDPERLADVDAREPMPARAETPRKVARERRRSAAKTPIPPDWTPSERVYAWAEAHAMGRAQVDDELAEFRIYWGDAGVNRASWDATLINRLKQLIDRRTSARTGATPTLSRRSPDAETHVRDACAEPSFDDGATPLECIPWLSEQDLVYIRAGVHQPA